MVSRIILLWTIMIPYLSFAQEKCSCAKDISDRWHTKKTFLFENGQTIQLCGYSENAGNQTLYSEFVLTECKTNKKIGQWDATETCKINFNKDTLSVEKQYIFPIKGTYRSIPFYVVKYYQHNGGINTSNHFQPSLIQYSDTDIRKSITAFKKASNGNNEANMQIADQLFCAYVSGSIEAEACFNKFEKKLGPFDGAIAEQWEELKTLYQRYKKQQTILEAK